MSYAAACDYIMGLMRAETWLKAAPDDPNPAAAQFPFAALFPASGTSKRASDFRTDLHTINVEVHWTFAEMSRQAGDAKDHIEDILDMLQSDLSLGGTVDALTAVSYDFGPMAWGAVETFGYILHIEVKIQPAQT